MASDQRLFKILVLIVATCFLILFVLTLPVLWGDGHPGRPKANAIAKLVCVSSGILSAGSFLLSRLLESKSRKLRVSLGRGFQVTTMDREVQPNDIALTPKPQVEVVEPKCGKAGEGLMERKSDKA